MTDATDLPHEAIGQPARLSRWYLLYFVLAAFDVLTVAVSLTLNHNLMAVFTESVAANDISAHQLDAVAELRQLAGAVNAPGNDVFDSQAPAVERRRLDAAYARYLAQYVSIARTLGTEPDPKRRELLIQRLRQVARAMAVMLGEAQAIMGLFEQAQPALAGQRMATMDRKYAALNQRFAELEADIRTHQLQQLAAQRVTAERLRTWEYVLGGSMVLMVLGALAYGHRVRQGMQNAMAEREAIMNDLRKARDDAVAGARAKAQFLANMSHEIRTPMNGVMGMTELLSATSLDARQRRYLEAIHSSSDSLLAIINDILDFSKIEAGKVELDSQPFDLCELLEATMSSFAERAQRKGLELGCVYPESAATGFVGDPLRIRQVLTNLIGNAIKFTDHGEVWARVQVSGDEHRAELSIAVSDTGIGMDAHSLQRIFEPFTQADGSSTRRHGGTGLGLTISRQLLDAMNGTLSVDSREGAGSTFTICLSLPRADQGDSVRAARRRSLVGAHVLVVDDNATNREILTAHLTSWGAEVAAVEGADEALQLLEATPTSDGQASFTLAVLDRDMPGMDGLTLASTLSSAPSTRAMPLVMLSSVINALDAETIRRLGIVCYLEKPVRQSDLHQALQEALGAGSTEPTQAVAYMQSPGTTGALVAHEQGPAIGAGDRVRVLVAEDSLVNQLLMQEHLRVLGYDHEVVDDGEAAVQRITTSLAEGSTYQLVLMDCLMPVVDGFLATRRIRELESSLGSERMPIVALTANAMEGDRQRCIECGMDDYMSKPFTQEQLQRVLARWLPHVPGSLGDATAGRSRARG